MGPDMGNDERQRASGCKGDVVPALSGHTTITQHHPAAPLADLLKKAGRTRMAAWNMSQTLSQQQLEQRDRRV